MADVSTQVRIDGTEVPQYSRELLDAAGEARRISRDPNVPGYTDLDDLKRALEA